VTLPQLVVLDLAGTTVEDRGQVPEAFVAALAAHGLTVSREQLDAVRGSSKREAIASLVPAGTDHASRSAAAYSAFRDELGQRYRATGVHAIAGAEDAMRWLRSRGVRVALNTGFDREVTTMLLDALGWRTGLADAIVCGDDVPQGRPAPDLILRAMRDTSTTDAERVANVGDTTLDLEAGHRARVRWNVGVLSGAHPRAQLDRAPHTHLLDSVAALPGLFGDPG
jgi:phosphonatase-like hydrolase